MSIEKLKKRPLAPHLQIYRPQLTSLLSIFHRLSGMMLSLGSILIVVWLGAIAMGPSTYFYIAKWFTSPFGVSLFLLWAACFYFHLANGIRHLFWDWGWGFDLPTVYHSGWFVIGLTFALTLFTLWRVLNI